MENGGAKRVRTEESGFSLLELLVAVSIFGIAMSALSMTQVTSLALSRSNQDVTRATDAATSVLEALRDEQDFRGIFERWSADPAFDVRGLEPVQGDPDGRVGEVVFPGNGPSLLESGQDRLLGMPRDLDLDGAIDGDDHADDYRILPVLVRVRWRGAGGVQQVQMVGTLAAR